MKTIKAWGAIAACGLAAIPGYAKPDGSAADSGGMVRNGDFETAPTGGDRTGDAADPPGWSLVRDGDAQGDIVREDAAPPGPVGPHALRLTVTRMGRRCGAANSGGNGRMAVRVGAWYDVAFFCRTADKRHTGLVFSLESRDGRRVCARATIPEVGGEWQPYTLSLHAYAGDPRARLVVSPLDPGVLWLDGVSIVPRAAAPTP